MPTDEARSYLKTVFKREFHNYIETKLAGDFAFNLAKGLQSADAEIKSLNISISKLQSTSKMLLESSRTRYNDGLLAGQKGIRRTLDEVAVLKESYLDENDKLSTLLLNTEDEVDRLKQLIVQIETSLLHGVSDKELLALLSTKTVPEFETCPNCDSPLPECCGGIFKDEGGSCMYVETNQVVK